MPTGASSPQDRQRGRHRRTRFVWWRRPQLGTVEEVTVQELQRRRERERAYASRARHVLVLPRQRCAPGAPATDPDAVRYQGSARG